MVNKKVTLTIVEVRPSLRQYLPLFLENTLSVLDLRLKRQTVTTLEFDTRNP